VRKFLIVLLIVASHNLFSQAERPHPQLLIDDLVHWVSDEIIIRFSDDINVSFNQKNETEIAAVDRILKKYSIQEAEQLFPYQKTIPSGEKGFYTYSGKYVEYPKLTNIYRVRFDSGDDLMQVFELMDELQNLSGIILYAEPNYLMKTDALTPNDSLYSFQYNASQMNVDSVWHVMQDSSITDDGIVIAIIDTGVDTNHVDLQGKRFTNYIEANGLPGVDDDGNGFIDDVSGWDFVNLDNHAADDNSHGTHCAGIAVGKHNSKGIAGISKGAKYMPIKGLESSGGSNSATLAQGVVYAANNGADILSMSFGGYGRSLAQENALAYAYAFSLPVGAAGNDALCIRNDGLLCPDGRYPAPMYPGALTYVLAAQATQQNPGWNGYRVWFSNYDFDGPTFTDYPDEFNYEVYAPGAGIISTIPGGTYANYSGTSMACPAVAGSVAMYKAFRPNNTKEKLFIDYIMSWYDIKGTFTKNQGWTSPASFPSIDVVKAIWPEEQPLIWMKSFTILDSALGDGDFKLDAGEIVNGKVDVKNLGTYSDSVYVGVRMSQFEDKSVVHFIDSISFLGSISSYASMSNITSQFRFQIDSNVVNGRNISFNVYSWTPGGDTTSQDIVFEAQSGCEYNGIYPGTTIWSPDCQIIITGNSAFDTLIIKPGTVIQIDPGVGIGYSNISAVGKPDSMIVFTKNINAWGTWHEIKNFSTNPSVFKYCIFEYGGRTGSIGGDDIVGPGNVTSFEDCVFRYCHAWYGIGWNILNPSNTSYVKRSNFLYNLSNLAVVSLDDQYNWTGEFSNNNVSGNIYVQYYGEQPAVRFGNQSIINRISNNSFFKHGYQDNWYGSTRTTGYALGVRDGNGGGHSFSNYVNNYLDSNYYGTIDNSVIESNIFDFQEYSSFPSISGSLKKLSRPKKENHGHVFSIRLDSSEINIYNDPYHKLIGLGKHRVDIEFNRAMKTEVTPFVAFGVRQPYTQNIIADSSFWSNDSTVWTGFFNVTQLTSSDGYNRVSVRNALDNEGFEIPIEDYRFEFQLNVAGVLSTGFSAFGDSSSIKLDWTRPDSIPDLLGYNLYRSDTTVDVNGDGIFGDTVLINSSLLLDTNYRDNNVIGGNYYLYFYSSLRSNLTESQRSIGVWASPYASKPRVRTDKAIESTGSQGSVQFNSGVDPNFIATEARFQFGTSKTSFTNSTSWENVGSTYYEVPYSKSVQSLVPGEVYYYRVQAKNNLGLRTGKIDSLLTRSTPIVSLLSDSVLCFSDSLTLNVQALTPDTTLIVSVDFGDGTVKQGTQLKHKYTSHGLKTITVTLTGSFSEETVATKSVEILPQNISVIPTLSGPTTFCLGGALTITLPQGQSQYTWNTGDTTNSIIVTSSGSYTASYVNAYGCVVSSTAVNVVVNNLPTPGITAANSATSFCQGSSLTLAAPAGMTAYQWSLNGTAISGATSASYSATSAGSYTVLATNASGCSSLSAAYAVTVDALPSAVISAGSATTFCQGDSVVLSAPSGYSYLWSNGATTSSITAKTAGTYSVVVTNANGCSVTSTPTTVTVNYIPTMAVTTTGSTSFCSGGSVTLTAAGGFASYLWSNGATTQSIIVNASGSYTVTGYTASGCTSSSSATSVVVSALPVASVSASGSTTFCQGDSVVLSAPAGYSYLWSTGATTQNIVAKDAGSYGVTVVDGSGCSSSSTLTTVVVNTPTRPSVAANGATTFCQGGSVVLSIPSGYSNRMWNTGTMGTSITVTQSGTYYVTAQTSNGCSVVSDTMTVVVNALPVSTISTTDPTTFCSGGSAVLNAPTGMTSYQWYKDGTAIVGATDSSLSASASGSYRVLVGNASGCSQLSTATAIVVNALPTATMSASGSTTFCQGDSVVLSAPAGYSYLWSNGATTQSISAKTAGSYTVTLTNANGCSATSAATSVTVNTIAVPSVSANGSTSFCQGGTVTLSAPSGYSSYLWSTGQSSQSITVSASGSYSVTVTNAAGCTSSSAATSVVVSALPVASVSASGSTTFCMGDSVVLSAPAGYSYLWSTGATTQSITVTSAGSYSVTLTNTAGCSATSAATTVTISTISAPTVVANGATTFCQGGSVTLSVPSGLGSYLWSNGATGSTITVNSAGTYSVTVTNATGCSATSTGVAVSVDPLPSVVATAQGSTTFCPGDSVQLMANPGLSNYVWNTGETGPSIWVKSAGSYSVQADNSTGCTGSSNAISVMLSPVPVTPTIYYSNNANLLISSAPMGNQWYLNGVAIPGADSTTWYPTQNGLYSIIVTNAAGCSSESAQFNYVNIGTDEWLKSQVRLFPNPNSGQFTVTYPDELNIKTVRMIDGLGRVLLEREAPDNRVEVDLGLVPNGLYRLELMGEQGYMYLPVTIQK